MATAIELYRKAYDLDYGQGDWESAQEIYKKIVERFPQAEEKEYALVHLERIEKLRGSPQEGVPLSLREKGKGRGGALAAITFVFLLLLAGAAGVAAFLFWPQYQDLSYQSHLLNGLLSEKLNDSREAVVNYRAAAVAHPKPVLAWKLLSELYLREAQPKLAEAAAVRWESLSPADPGLRDFRARLAAAQAGKAAHE